MKKNIQSPFGGQAVWRLAYPVRKIKARYELHGGIDVSEYFQGRDSIDLYECETTGYLFWRPESLAGNEEFYHKVAANISQYYSTERWEYRNARKYLLGAKQVLEVGCGEGWFLKSLEPYGVAGVGLEFNREAIAQKVTKSPIYKEDINEFAGSHSCEFDAVCLFQVLEHVIDPRTFIQSCAACLRPGGYLLASTPNHGRASLQAFEQAMDLPPHHMGYFTQEIYKRIADAMDLELVRCYIEPKKFGFSDTISERVAGSLPFRMANRCGVILYNAVLAMMKEQGQHILSVYRKKSCQL